MTMHVIAKRTLRQFWAANPEAEMPLTRWHTQMVKGRFNSYAELKAAFASADWVNGFIVFDIGGNKYRLIVDVVFASQTVFVKQVLTHKEYDRWKP